MFFFQMKLLNPAALAHRQFLSVNRKPNRSMFLWNLPIIFTNRTLITLQHTSLGRAIITHSIFKERVFGVLVVAIILVERWNFDFEYIWVNIHFARSATANQPLRNHIIYLPACEFGLAWVVTESFVLHVADLSLRISGAWRNWSK